MLSEPDFQDLLAKIPKATLGQLKQIVGRCNMIISVSPTEAAGDEEQNHEGHLLYDALSLAYRETTGHIMGSWVQFLSSRQSAHFKKVSGEICTTLNAGLAGPLKRIEKMAYYRKAGESLCRYMISMNIPLSPSSLMRNLHLLVVAFDKDWPGYRVARMGAMVIKKQD